jgi:hypothetical protein
MRKFVACSVALATVLSAVGLAISAPAAPAAPAMSPKQSQGTEPNARTIVQDLRRQKLPIRLTVVYTAKTDPNHLLGRRDGYTSKVAFVDSRVPKSYVRVGNKGDVGLGGSVEIWPSASLATERATYIQELALTLSLPVPALYMKEGIDERDFIAGGVLLRISFGLTARDIAGYAKALAAVTDVPVSQVRVPGVGWTNIVSGPLSGKYSVKLVRLITDLHWLSTAPVAGTEPVAAEFRIVNTGHGVIRDDADTDAVIVGSNNQIYGPIAGEGVEGTCTDFDNGSFVLAAGATAVGCTSFAIPLAALQDHMTLYGLRMKVAKVQWSPDAGQGTVGSWTVGQLAGF